MFCFIFSFQEAAWVISNIVAGSLQHKQLVFCSAILPALLHLLATSTFDVRKEAAYALGNLCVMPAGESKVPHPIMDHLTILLERGCLPGFINLVKSPDVEASRLGLQFLELVNITIQSLNCHTLSKFQFICVRDCLYIHTYKHACIPAVSVYIHA